METWRPWTKRRQTGSAPPACYHLQVIPADQRTSANPTLAIPSPLCKTPAKARTSVIDAGNFDLILLAEHRLGLPPLFYFKVMDIKDDWAFILKLHALFEGAVHRLLAEKTAQFEFAEPVPSERDSFFTKVQTAARLFLPDNRDEAYIPAREYLLALNHLRNRITHDLWLDQHGSGPLRCYAFCGRVPASGTIHGDFLPGSIP